MPLSDAANVNGATEPAQETPESDGPEIDLKVLAEKIYELLKEEARLERERLGRHQSW